MKWLSEGTLRLKDAWSSIGNQVSLWGSQIATLPIRKKIIYGSLMAGGVGGGIGFFGPMGFAVQMGIFLPFTLMQAAVLSIKDNKTFNFAAAGTAPMSGALKLGIGAYGYAAMAFTAGLRHLTFGYLSEDWLNKGKGVSNRVKVGAGFCAAGAGVASYAGVYFSPWHFLPVASMTMGTIATAIPSNKDDPQKDRSHISRALYLTANSLNSIYSLGFSQLISAVSADVLATRNLAVAIDKFDTAYLDTDGAKVSASKRFRIAAKKVFLYRPNTVEGFTQADVSAGKHMSVWRSSSLSPENQSAAYEAWIKAAAKNADLKKAYGVSSAEELRQQYPQASLFGRNVA